MSSYQIWDAIVRMGQPGGWETQLGGAGEEERGPRGMLAQATGGCPDWWPGEPQEGHGRHPGWSHHRV